MQSTPIYEPLIFFFFFQKPYLVVQLKQGKKG